MTSARPFRCLPASSTAGPAAQTLARPDWRPHMLSRCHHPHTKLLISDNCEHSMNENSIIQSKVPAAIGLHDLLTVSGISGTACMAWTLRQCSVSAAGRVIRGV